MDENRPEKREWKPTPWAFISSVKADFQEYRQAVIEACVRARVLPIAMETWTASKRPSLEVCYNHIEECDITILVVGYRYGTIHPGSGKSYTELEWDKASSSGKPVFTFVASSMDNVEVQRVNPREIESTRRFLKKVNNTQWGQFSNPQQLHGLVYQALMEWRKEVEGEKSSDNLTEGEMLVLFMSAPDTAERTMKKMLHKLKRTMKDDRDSAIATIIAEFEAEIQKQEKVHQTGNDKMEKLVAKTAAGILERELTNFMHEVEHGQEAPYEVYKTVLDKMIVFEKTRWKSSDSE